MAFDTFDLVINIMAFSYVDNQPLTSSHVSITIVVDFQISCTSIVTVLSLFVSGAITSHFIYFHLLDITLSGLLCLSLAMESLGLLWITFA